LWRATDEFNLTRRDFKDDDYETGIWDGEKFIFTVSLSTPHGITNSLSARSSRVVGGILLRSSGGMASMRHEKLMLREFTHSNALSA
jgi:hypothetical protein